MQVGSFPGSPEILCSPAGALSPQAVTNERGALDHTRHKFVYQPPGRWFNCDGTKVRQKVALRCRVVASGQPEAGTYRDSCGSGNRAAQREFVGLAYGTWNVSPIGPRRVPSIAVGVRQREAGAPANNSR